MNGGGFPRVCVEVGGVIPRSVTMGIAPEGQGLRALFKDVVKFIERSKKCHFL